MFKQEPGLEINCICMLMTALVQKERELLRYFKYGITWVLFDQWDIIGRHH